MCKLVNDLKELAKQVISKEHRELDVIFTSQDKMDFVNSVKTLSEHSHHLVRELTEAA